MALLPYAASLEIEDYLAETCGNIAEIARQAAVGAIAAIDAYEFALVTGGMGDLFALPIRITKLGWAGFAAHVQLDLGGAAQDPARPLADLFARLYKTYALSLVAMSSRPSRSPCCRLLRAQDCRTRASNCSAICSHPAWIAADGLRVNIEAPKILGFLLARATLPTEQSVDVVAQPTELALVLLRASRLFGLTDEVDQSRSQLDHLPLSAYLPAEFLGFGDNHVQDGTDAVFHVGNDVWTGGDVDAAWPALGAPSLGWTAILASFLFPDRTPWFLLPPLSLVEGEFEHQPETTSAP